MQLLSVEYNALSQVEPRFLTSVPLLCCFALLLCAVLLNTNICFLVGGFQKGTFGGHHMLNDWCGRCKGLQIFVLLLVHLGLLEERFFI